MKHQSLIRKFISLGLTLAVLYSIGKSPCWAGDQTNLNLLIQGAVKKDPNIQKWRADIEDELFGSSMGDHSETIMDILTDSMYGVTFGLNSYKTNLITGLAATGIGLSSYLISDIRETRSKKQVRRKLANIRLEYAKLEQEVQQLYTALKLGSPEAHDQLITMTNAAIVEEVETNLAMESYFKNQLDRKAIPASSSNPETKSQ